jgi:transcriptional regulator with XRE-family HTH domain
MGDVFERIKKIRKDNKLNQQEFARIIDLSQTHISKIENGKDNPSDKVLRTIAVEFGISFEWLKTGQGDMHDKSHSKNRDVQLKDCMLPLKKYLQSCNEGEYLFCTKHVFDIPELFEIADFRSKNGDKKIDIGALVGLDSMLSLIDDYVRYVCGETETIISSGQTEENMQDKFAEMESIKERYKAKMLRAMDEFFACFLVAKDE